MAVRKTDSEFGGRGGQLPPAEFVVTADLDSAALARLQRLSEPTSADDTDEAVRARLEKRAKRNDTVGR